MVFICILGSVPFWVGSKGKEGHPLLECTEVPSKNKPSNACYLSLLYIYIKVWPDEGFPAQKNIFYLCLPMVFMYRFGSVSFGVGLKGKERFWTLKE